MNNIFSGQYSNTIDEKGRIMLPAKLRSAVDGRRLVLTRGIEDCLILLLHEEWDAFLEKFFRIASLLEQRFRLLQRRMIAPAQECSLTASGRLLIPKPLLSEGGLQSQQECTVLGMYSYIELWDSGRYQAYSHKHGQEYVDAAEEISRQLGGFLTRV